MNKYTLGTIVGTALLPFLKGKGSKSKIGVEDIYDLSAEQKAQITDLCLTFKGIRHLADDIFDGFTNLEYLVLNDNQLTELPESIGNLTNLKELWLHRNQLTELPDSIGNLTNLTTLSLSNNQLTELPDSIGNLTKLEELRLGDNQLTELPESIGNLSNLEDLWLDDNPWQKPVPKEIILKMIRNRVHKRVIKEIIDMNNSIPTKSNLRLR